MTPAAEFHAMVERVEAELRITPAGYTLRIRELEARVDQVAVVTPTALPDAIHQLEVAWRTEIAKARRLAQGGSR